MYRKGHYRVLEVTMSDFLSLLGVMASFLLPPSKYHTSFFIENSGLKLYMKGFWEMQFLDFKRCDDGDGAKFVADNPPDLVQNLHKCKDQSDEEKNFKTFLTNALCFLTCILVSH